MPEQRTLDDASPPLQVGRDDTLGALFLGGFFTTILYGILCLQMYTFFNRLSQEKRVMIYSVATLWLLSTCYIAFVAHPLYILLIKDFAYPLDSRRLPWTVGVCHSALYCGNALSDATNLEAAAIITSLTDVIVRCWFTYRIWILSDKCRTLVISLAIVIVADFATGIWSGINALPSSHNPGSLDRIASLFYATGILLVFTDIYIAACLCYQLYRRKETYISRTTNSMLNLLMVYAVNTGFVTAIVVLCIVITRAAMPGNYVFLGIYFTLGPLYVNALMGSLNARDWFRRRSSTREHISIPLGSLHISPPSNSNSGDVDDEYGDHPVQDKTVPNHGVVFHIQTDEHVGEA